MLDGTVSVLLVGVGTMEVGVADELTAASFSTGSNGTRITMPPRHHWCGTTHRSRDAPLPPLPTVSRGGHISGACPGGPGPPYSPGVGSRCAHIVPTVYASAYQGER